MGCIRFALRKILLFFILLICPVLYPVLKANEGTKKFVVQISSSKTQINIPEFKKQYHLTDSIYEVWSNGWYGYFAGSFDNFEAASEYARMLSEQKGLLKPIPRNQVEKTGKTNIIVPDSVKQKNILEVGTKTEFSEKIDSINNNQDYSQPAVKAESRTKGIQENEVLIIGGRVVADFRRVLAKYGETHFTGLFQRKFRQIVEATYNFPIILLFIFLILLFILNIAVVLIVLYISNWLKNKHDRHTKEYRALYEKVLLSYLFGESDWESTKAKLIKISKPLNRKIFISVLFNFSENLRGEMDKELPEIYKKLGLENDSLKSSKSSFYYRKVLGIRELTYFYPEKAKAVIPGYLNSKNDLVRAEAQNAYVMLHSDDPFGFFKTLSKPFTRWTQMSAFYIFRQNPLPSIQFGDYLNSKNPHVRLFSLWMVIFFQQLENSSEILKLLDDSSEAIRFLAIKAVNDLRLYDGRVLIKGRYRLESNKNKLEILKAFRNVGSEEDFEFLKSVILTGSTSETTEACRSLYYLNNEGRKLLFQINRETGKNLGPYISHIIDTRNS